MQKNRQILVTTALPYANAPLHLGYILEAIQADIWVRTQRMLGHTCYFVCGDDAHGAPIMLKAEKENISPEQWVATIYASHVRDLEAYNISFDNYHTTHSVENEQLAGEIYSKLQANGDIIIKDVPQAYDASKKMFLPDRFVQGTCPKCNADNQYGDSCEQCGATYTPLELINPRSVLTGAAPELRTSTHYFFAVQHYQAALEKWLANGHIAVEVANKLQEWFTAELLPWDISRDAPYFGFLIPGTTDKYFYVWLDAPIGYIASMKNYCVKNNLDFAQFFAPASQTELYHFIGKDIVYFHAVFWPAMLMGAGLKTPNHIFVHGFVTVDGKKMSKSRGTFILAETFAKQLDTDLLRYYFASKLNSRIEDLDFNIEDFVAKINADLVGKLVNIASRSATFIDKHFANILSNDLHNSDMLNKFIALQEEIVTHYNDREYHLVIRLVTKFADLANKYIDEHKPWILARDSANYDVLHKIVSDAIRMFKILMCYLAPVVPNLTTKVAKFLNSEINFASVNNLLLGHKINSFIPLIQRLDLIEVKNIMNANTDTPSATANIDSPDTAMSGSSIPQQAYISIDDFSKVDLRIAKILTAEEVAGSDKLLHLTVDIGESATRQIFAGIKEHYKPEDLIGKLTMVVANLAPRKIRFGTSEGMLALAGGKEGLFLLEPQAGAVPGMRIK